jgi:hypothetical protein
LELISAEPRIGARAGNVKLADVRRIHYYLYYRVHEAPKVVETLALWHASRGSGPGL